MPGSMPAISQLDWLISMTAMIVLPPRRGNSRRKAGAYARTVHGEDNGQLILPGVAHIRIICLAETVSIRFRSGLFAGVSRIQTAGPSRKTSRSLRGAGSAAEAKRAEPQRRPTVAPTLNQHI